MPEPLASEALEAEFRTLVARAGVTVPEARMPAILAGYADFRAQLHWLRGGRDHSAELSNVFSLPKPEAK